MTEQHYLSVTALSNYLSKKFDVDPYLKTVFVKGEISNFNGRRQGTQYFNLKDTQAIIPAICFKPLQVNLEDGMQVLVVGAIKLSAKYGRYNLIVEHIEVSGEGDLFQKFQQLKDKLKMEGMFDLPKKAIPSFPKRIAVITSESGAVLHDIQTTILNRFPIVQLDIYPTIVQGNESSKSIVSSFKRIATSNFIYDTVIIARGGGSIEDLWSFNEEIVVKAIADCQYPVISSIGHETDTTLSDLVADIRVATPTAAAQVATPVLVDVQNKANQLQQRLVNYIHTKLNHMYMRYDNCSHSYIFKQPERLYDSYFKKYGQVTEKMTIYSQQLLKEKSQCFDKLQMALHVHSPIKVVELQYNKLLQLEEQLMTKQQKHYTHLEKQFDLLVQKLDLLSPLKSMARGYSIVLKGNKVISTVSKLKAKDTLQIEMSDGTITTSIETIEEKNRHGN